MKPFRGPRKTSTKVVLLDHVSKYSMVRVLKITYKEITAARTLVNEEYRVQTDIDGVKNLYPQRYESLEASTPLFYVLLRLYT